MVMCWGLSGVLSFPSGGRLLCSYAQYHIGGNIIPKCDAASPQHASRSCFLSAGCAFPHGGHEARGVQHTWGFLYT